VRGKPTLTRHLRTPRASSPGPGSSPPHRVRNSDLPTALSVLTHGTYTRLPSTLTDAFRLPPTLPDDLALRTLTELDELLRWRLGALDRVPLPLARHGWTIADGRVRFRIPGLWEATLTYSGDEGDAQGEWYLLTVEFLFRVRDARGVWAGVPVGAMKEHIVELANRELAWRRVHADAADRPGAVVVGDAPLERGYAFLQRLALRYQLEAVYEQAARLAGTAWAGHLKVQRLNQQTEISLGYWPPPKHAANVPANAAPAPPPATGNLIISLAPINLSASTTPAPATRTNSTQLSASTSSARPSPLPMRSARERALDQAMAKVAAGRVAADGLAEVGVAAEGDKEVELEDVPERLQMAWVADDVPDEVRAQLSLELDAELDVGALLSRVTEAHARAALNQIHSQLTAELGSDEFDLVDPAAATPTFAGTSSDAQAPATTAPYIRAHLHGQQFVRLAIPPTTGRLEFVAEGEVGADREKRLRSFAEKADRDRRLVTDAVQRVKSSTLLDEVDSRAAYLGLSTTRRIPLRNPDLAKFGAHTLGALYVRLPQLSSHFLVLVLNAQGFRFALIAVRDGGDPSQALVIDEIGWLDKAKITGAQGKGKGRQASEGEGVCDATAGFEVTIDELKALHDYSVRRIASFKIESQLHARRIAYRTVIPPVPAGAKGGAGAAAPYLVVRSDDLLRGHVGQRVAWPNLAIRCGVVKVDGEDVVRVSHYSV